jgi:hypothetical protein
MAVFLNTTLGLVLVILGLGIFYQNATCVDLAGSLRDRLKTVLGPDFQIHDWVFSLVFLILGGLALLSAFMRSAANQYFWVLQ